jgi:hypothetical protein
VQRDRHFHWIAALTLAVALPACDEDDPGSAPTISDLAVDASGVRIDEPSLVLLNFSFEDPDGDLDMVTISLQAGGEAQEVQAPIEGAADVTEGEVPAAMAVQIAAAGTYSFGLWVVDAEGNESNHLDGEYVVEAP